MAQLHGNPLVSGCGRILRFVTRSGRAAGPPDITLQNPSWILLSIGDDVLFFRLHPEGSGQEVDS